MTDSEAFEELLSAQDIAELFGSESAVPDDIKSLFEPAPPQETVVNPPAQNHSASFPLLSSEEDLISALFEDAPAPAPAPAEVPEGITSLFGPEDDFSFSPFEEKKAPAPPPPSEPTPSPPEARPEPPPEKVQDPSPAQTPVRDPSIDVDAFLTTFAQHCVAFGYYCDQYMRQEINLGEITRHMSQATGEGEAFFDKHHTSMSPEEVYRYQVMQKTLDDMATSLIETEIQRNREVIQEAMSNGEYFIVNITFNSIHSSIYMVYNAPGERQKLERDHKLALLQEEQELTQALMKVLKVIDQKKEPPSLTLEEFQKLHKALHIYVEYFKKVDYPEIKKASDQRVLRQMTEFVEHCESRGYFGNRREVFRYTSEFIATLKSGMTKEVHTDLDTLRERLRPPDPSKELDRLYQVALQAEGEANVYSAVIAFNNFAEANANLPKVRLYKQEIRQSIQRKGLS